MILLRKSNFETECQILKVINMNVIDFPIIESGNAAVKFIKELRIKYLSPKTSVLVVLLPICINILGT